jgi:predicted porin
MQKKILVMAVAAVVAAPAISAAKDMGDDNVVELYGRAYPEVIIPHGHGATDADATVATFAGKPTGENSVIRRTEMSSSNSRLGVRGQEKLGGTLKAIFQLETEFHLDSNDSAFAQRNSFVGLSDKKWGTIKLGRMDTPFKTYGDDLSFLSVGSGNFVSSSNVLRKTGFGTNSASSFHLRRQNAVQYESPTFAGLDFAVQYSTNEADTETRKARVWSGGVEWASGPLKVSLAHEIHWDLFGMSRNVPSSMSNFNDQSVHSKDKATQAMIEYKLGKIHKFEADYIRKEYKEDATLPGRALSYKNNAYEFIWSARWSKQWRTDVAYIRSEKGSCSRVDAVCNTDGLEGSQLQAGVAYYFSPRTYIFFMGALLKNGFSSRYNNEDLQDVSVGEDVMQWALGLSHSF